MYHIRKSEWLLRFTGRPGSTAKPRNNDSGMARCSNSTGDRRATPPAWLPWCRVAVDSGHRRDDRPRDYSPYRRRRPDHGPGNRIKLPGRRNPGEGYPWYKPPPKSLGIGLLVSSRGICRRRALIRVACCCFSSPAG